MQFLRSRREGFVPIGDPDLTLEAVESVGTVLRSGWLTTGSEVSRFEAEFSHSLGLPQAVAVSSCTAGIHLILRALDLPANFGVVIPDWTFVSVANMVELCGGRTVLVDIEAETHNIDPNDLDRKLAMHSDIRVAIIPHFNGVLANMERIMDICRKHGVFVIEDCAHAIGSTNDGERAGAIGDASVFSFYANKVLTTGEGGMVVTGNRSLRDRLLTLRLHGMTKTAIDRYNENGSWWYDVDEPGFKYNLTDVAAAMGRAQLKHLSTLLQRRRDIAGQYEAAFARMPQIACLKHADSETWWMYPVQVERRNEMVEFLRHHGIGTSVHFIPIHRFTYYRSKYRLSDDDLPTASEAFLSAISLPMFASMTDLEVESVIGNVERFYAKRV